ncbi:YobI family P-loop NTPase [Flavobacterium johnsoniae]|uniref:YobI-like P-loop NTPase domain-containing protein n=1 Tax=Flavobacterium johnsoniae (strain ATCC 17061 / DSM 2064 / JCM 8514 / BCRC 14874 / CCUG 350202 / NBRC 14942 / NCIMB 11054 / UW101) TaxID=376686 RepID=A5FF60_FLAJ1|nr:hypothetical protein [Flavobacterium johnsoniae]ABQ06163.1 hypothetical protein Fjoh_3146 [Flavobacterium johnsoniae UW101]OXE98363.1 hypothetical protein B0A63_15565 [Flavobacterium johnsoniae UW101]WQG81909.1 hypothetical protein SR927_02145 [Flavobacterium johnsoniae UW101]
MSQVQKKNKFNVVEKIESKKIEVLNNFLPNVIKHLSLYLTKINKSTFDNLEEFEDFGPVVLTGEEDKHSKRIKYAIDNPAILNLALTGPMGSGKSTILKTFEHNYRQYKCLNISLATFDKKTLDTDKIEHNILKQLFYSVEHKKIPESRFKRIENLKGIKFKAFLFILWLCSVSFFLKLEVFNELKETLHLSFYSGFLSFIYGLYFIAYTCFLVFMLMSFVLNFKLTKFKIKDMDFDNSEDKKTVNFENEIDEILYFFERNPIEIVFFQDLDRFNESEIFIKLREINNLINNYEPIKKRRKITFIYAVCDDIFKENERAKFFDFIIPVIPVINYTSSSSKLLSKLKEDILSNKLSKDFIDDVSLFLNDYRTIKSIFNEYQIYKSIIGNQLESYDNLLAMMIYKNIEPTDFDKLNLNQGYVYAVFENIKELTAEKNKEFITITKELNEKLLQTTEEKLKNLKELRMVYILIFFELNMTRNNYAVYGFYLQHDKRTIDDLLTDEYFELFRKQTNITYYYNQYSSQGSSISFAEIEKKAGNQKYAQRLQVIANKQTDNLNKIKSELYEIERKQKELDSKKLYEILDSHNSTVYFSKHAIENSHINNSKLINYLLSGGYINEDYNHYISHFHPGSIAQEDNDFLLSLLPSEKPLPYTHKLKEISSLIKRIKPENFGKEAILNLSLIDYLIENKKTVKLKQVITLLSKDNQMSLGFIEEYINHAEEVNRAVFFKTLAESWDGMWIYLTDKSNFTTDKIESYLFYIFKYLDQATINRVDISDKLSIYIGEMENLNCFYKNGDSINSLKDFLKKGTVKFENLSYDHDHKELFEFIYDHNLYVINERMISLFILNFDLKSPNAGKLKTENYTTIQNSDRSKLIQYVDQNLDLYLENVFLKLENNTDESQENLCTILNNEDLNVRFDLVEHGRFSITDLSKINNAEIQAVLIIYGKIETKWENILVYYKQIKAFDEVLVDYLNLKDNYEKLSKQGYIKDPNEALKKDFIKDLIRSAISDESFGEIIVNIPFAYKNMTDFGEISDLKMQSLIEFKRVLLSATNYRFIKEKFRNLLIFLLEVNIADFVMEIESFELESRIIVEILSSKVISPLQKLKIVENTSDEILSASTEVLVELGKFLSVNKINNISFILLSQLIENALLDSLKIELINQYFSFIENINLCSIIEKIDEFSKLTRGKYPKVIDNEVNRRLIANLERTLISKTKRSKDTGFIELIPYSKPRI